MHLITLQAEADQQPPQTCARALSSFLGTQIDAEALQESNEEEDIGQRNMPLAEATY